MNDDREARRHDTSEGTAPDPVRTPDPGDSRTPRAINGSARLRRFPVFRASSAPLVIGVLVLIATAVVWFTRPPGYVQGSRTQSIAVTGVSIPILHDAEIVQPIEATQDGFTAVMATFGTYGGAEDCALDVTVRDEGGTTISDQRVPCGALTDTSNASRVASFPPIDNSAGHRYVVTYRAAPGAWTQGVSLWTGDPKDAALPATGAGADPLVRLFANGRTATETIAEYRAPSVWAQVWLAIGTAALEGPWWTQPAAMAVWILAALASVLLALTMRRSTRALVISMVVLALCRGLIWSAIMPPLEGMDEGAHAAYAQFLAVEHHVPVRGQAYDHLKPTLSEQLAVLDEYQNRGGLPPADRADHTKSALTTLHQELATASPRANGSNSAAGYPPAYYAPAAMAYLLTPGTFDDKVYGMRLWSVLLGGLAAWATVLVALRLFPRSRLAAALLGMAVTLQPMMAHQFAIVNNDGLAIAAGIAALACALSLATGTARWRASVVAGVCVGLALLAKPYGAAALPVVALAALIGALREAPRWRRLVRSLVGVAAGVVVTYGPWLLAQRLFGIPSTSLPVYSDGDQSRGMRHYLHLQVLDGFASVRLRWGEQLFGTFSWLDIHLPGPAYGAIWFALRVTAALMLLWLLWQAVVLVRGVVQRLRSGSNAVTGALKDLGGLDGDVLNGTTRTGLAVVHTIGTLAVLYAAGYLYFRYSGRDELLQGRYALLALPAVLALPALAIEGLVSRLASHRARQLAPVVAMGAVALSMWVLQILSISTVANRFYL